MHPKILERLHVYTRLMRVEKPIGTLLLLWPTLWALMIAGSGKPDFLIVCMLTLGTFFMRSAGCVINDFADRKVDGQVKRTKNRPFATQAVTEKEAYCLTIFLVVCAAMCLLPLNRLTVLMSLLALFLAMTYPFTKRFLSLPQAYLGLAFSFGIPMAFAAELGTVPALAWLLFVANVMWTIAYDTIYAIVDKEDDLLLGMKTSAITFGRFDVFFVMVFHILFLLLLIILGWLLEFNWFYYLSLLAVLSLQLKQLQEIRHRDRQQCFQAFLENNTIGYVILLGLIGHYWLVR